MRIRARLVLVFLACGLLPLIVASVSELPYGAHGMEQIGEAAERDLKQKALNQLVALRDVKRNQVESYFATIRDQMVTFSQNRMIVEAMAEFRAAFAAMRAENQIDGATLQQQRRALLEYYVQDFLEHLPGIQRRRRSERRAVPCPA